MKLRAVLLLSAVVAIGAFGVLLAQKPFIEYPGQNTGIPLPSDWEEKHEWVFGRLRYSPYGGGGGGFGGGRRGGRFGRSSWGTDYPQGDRLLVQGLKRITRLDARSVEQVIDMDGSDDAYNWPFLYAVEVGQWQLSDSEAAQMRDYINRGGFFMVDDFHGTYQWRTFEESMRKVFPDRPIVDIPNDDQIFHNLFDLENRIQVPGAQVLGSGRTYEQDGYEARWRGIYDAKGRLVVVICHNMDLGDALEYSDEPAYPEKYSALAFRIVANYAVYDMTH
jgi:Domain of unknown function (DUF4159)